MGDSRHAQGFTEDVALQGHHALAHLLGAAGIDEKIHREGAVIPQDLPVEEILIVGPPQVPELLRPEYPVGGGDRLMLLSGGHGIPEGSGQSPDALARRQPVFLIELPVGFGDPLMKLEHVRTVQKSRLRHTVGEMEMGPRVGAGAQKLLQAVLFPLRQIAHAITELYGALHPGHGLVVQHQLGGKDAAGGRILGALAGGEGEDEVFFVLFSEIVLVGPEIPAHIAAAQVMGSLQPLGKAIFVEGPVEINGSGDKIPGIACSCRTPDNLQTFFRAVNPPASDEDPLGERIACGMLKEGIRMERISGGDRQDRFGRHLIRGPDKPLPFQVSPHGVGEAQLILFQNSPEGVSPQSPDAGALCLGPLPDGAVDAEHQKGHQDGGVLLIMEDRLLKLMVQFFQPIDRIGSAQKRCRIDGRFLRGLPPGACHLRDPGGNLL